MEISKKLYLLRTEYGLTQSQFAEIAGVSDRSVSAWEKGTRDPKIKPLMKLCEHFKIDLHTFIDKTSDIYDQSAALPTSGSSISPARQQLIDATKDMDDQTLNAVLEVVKSVKRLKGE